jgi:hypothetical protein
MRTRQSTEWRERAYFGPRRRSARHPVTLDVRQKYMPPAIAHFESRAPRQRIWRDAMRLQTTEASQKEYPEAAITPTAAPDRQAFCHSRNIPEARPDMITDFPIRALATGRPKRKYSRKMISTSQRSARAQATFHAISDHEENIANRPMDLTTGTQDVSIGSAFDVRPLRHRACKKQSRPSAFTVHLCIPHAPSPVAGHRGR